MEHSWCPHRAVVDMEQILLSEQARDQVSDDVDQIELSVDTILHFSAVIDNHASQTWICFGWFAWRCMSYTSIWVSSRVDESNST
jgi:hypothetical protein